MILTKDKLIEGTEERLMKLSAYLKNLPSQVEFDMADFHTKIPVVEDNTVTHICATSACAVGHYALMEDYDATSWGVKPKVITEDWLRLTDEWVHPERMDWTGFCTKIIGVPAEAGNSRIFEWLFGSSWETVDNTPRGAAARIDYFLAHGVPREYASLSLTDRELAADEFQHLYADYLNLTGVTTDE